MGSGCCNWYYTIFYLFIFKAHPKPGVTLHKQWRITSERTGVKLVKLICVIGPTPFQDSCLLKASGLLPTSLPLSKVLNV